MKYNQGDRFEFTFGGWNYHMSIWEVLYFDHSYGKYFAVCLEGSPDIEGEKNYWAFDSSWRYLGNFNKDTNFNTLYDILNESTDI